MMPFLRTLPANDGDSTDTETTSFDDEARREFDWWCANQEFLEHCIQVDGIILDGSSELSFQEQYNTGMGRRAENTSMS